MICSGCGCEERTSDRVSFAFHQQNTRRGRILTWEKNFIDSIAIRIGSGFDAEDDCSGLLSLHLPHCNGRE